MASLALGVGTFGCGGTTAPDIDGGGGGDGGGSDGSKSDGGGGADSGGGPCDGGACPIGLTCCNDSCVNENNDPLHCGGCGTSCSGSTGMCQGGSCIAPTCQPGCGDGEVCCDVQGPGPSGPPQCLPGPTCPVGCPLCQ
jgi:hypothetical protein